MYPTGPALSKFGGADREGAVDMYADEDLWIFAYGSLMWCPNFVHIERVEALLWGAHRILSVFSHVSRGTPECPGLGFGLDRGGSCRGIAYRVSAECRGPVLSQVRARELVTNVYRECFRSISLIGNRRRRVKALCYMTERNHPQYAGQLSLDDQVRFVLQGHGTNGSNRRYVLDTVRELETLGCCDERLRKLAARLDPDAFK